MKRFAVVLAAFLLLQGAVGAGVVAYYKQELPDPNDFIAATRDKAALLDAAPSPKVILVGGSNVAMGIDSAAVAEALPLQPVNNGLLSGVGIEMMAAQVEPHLQEGDVVIISLEYERWVHFFHALTVWRLLDHHPAAWRDTPASYLPELLDTALAYLGEVARAARLKGTGFSPPRNTAPYLRGGFNEFGDQTLHWDIVVDRERPIGQAEIDALAELSEAHVRETIALVNDFGERARSQGALVYLTYPALTPDAYAAWADELGWLHALLEDELAIPVLDGPEELVYPREQFTDQIYHLNRAGIDRRMGHLLSRLTDQLVADGHPAAAVMSRSAQGLHRSPGQQCC